MSLFTSFIGKCAAVIFPPLCPMCKNPVGEHAGLCSSCFQKLKFIQPPFCQICGQPLGIYETGAHLCPDCLKHKPAFDYGRSVFVYDAFSKKLILNFKHADALSLTPLLVRLLLPTAQEMAKTIDYIIPVPLHWKRLLNRRYNQSALLARQIAKQLGKPCVFYLKRTKHTPPQGHFDTKKRIQNVEGAFHLSHPDVLSGKSVLLIDDVRTTGATLDECARTLKQAGVRLVYVLTLAKTVTK